MQERLRIVLIIVGVLAGGCTGDEDDASPDATPESEFGCVSRSGGELFDLSLGFKIPDGDHVPIEDGDEVPVVLGIQGIYMVLLESHASLSVDTDSICLDCSIDVSPSPSGAFEGAHFDGDIGFEKMPTGEFNGGYIVPLWPGTDRDALVGAEVDITASCDGHGFSGDVTRSVVLMPD